MGLGRQRTQAVAVGALGAVRARAARLRPAAGLWQAYAEAFAVEWETRRLFLWLPVCAGTGVLLYLAAGHEPVAWMAPLLATVFAGAAVLLRPRRAPVLVAIGLAALFAGFSSAQWRSARVDAPVLDHIRIATLAGFVEEADHRRNGSRFVLKVTSAEGLDPAHAPSRVRLTARRDDAIEAGAFVTVKARLLPPAAAALPGGYSFARDAYFEGFGAVGSVLGHALATPPPAAAPFRLAFAMAIDRTRNTLATRVDAILGGDTGAIAAAMVTGKRELLSQDGRELIREAGIFHIITIAGVQMTLVAGLLFGLVRRALALSPTLALRHPIKKWAALAAIAGAVAYDIFTGSRIGTQRALFMTLIMLGAVLVDRRGFTMRNLALAALLVILIEPETITGASFQLSFAAVAALVAVYEARERRREVGEPVKPARDGRGAMPAWWRLGAAGWAHGRDLMLATMAATGATASFMAGNFHEFSPYVLFGNPLTLGIIEIFAVPGALLGAVLYPLGLDGPVWHWVGAGIAVVLWAARLIAAAPAATIDVPAFAPWALPVLALAVLSLVIWRTVPFRLTAVPLLLAGLAGTMLGPRYDLLVMPGGEAVGIRGPDGRLALVGKGSGFSVEQWLRADGDGRPSAASLPGVRCDKLACIAPLAGGQTLSLVSDARAFGEDCRRVDVVVTRLRAPPSCGAALIIDRDSLAATGALGLVLRNGGWVATATRGILEDRPWSPAPTTPRRAGQGTMVDRGGVGPSSDAVPDDPPSDP